MQIYRSMTEAARAIVGEVTTWPSRQVEKLAMLRLMRSPGLMALQRRMLSVIVDERWTEKLNLTNYKKFAAWEYLPYYLRGKVSEKVDDGVAAPRVLGALHDCLAEEEDTRKYVDKSAIAAFMKLEDGKEYARWRLLPPLIRNQVMLSDLARLLPFGKQECSHVRFQFPLKALDGLPSLVNFAGWPAEVVVHKTANPQDPGRAFPFASGWSRNEVCPSVISSRLVLAPLYAGTSGHSQGRILSWRKVQSKNLEDVPVGLVIAAGYSVLWRLYYDKRVSGFHTLFEALQSAFVDEVYKPGKVVPFKDDAIFDLLLKVTGPRSIDVRAFWVECLKAFGRPGPAFAAAHKVSLAEERDVTMKAFPGTVIPHWGETEDPSATAPEVAVWTGTSNRKAYDEWMLLLAAATPLPPDDDDDF